MLYLGAMKILWFCPVVALCACGPIDQLPTSNAEAIGVTRQEGKTDQGKTDQGKTDQGKTDQGKTDQGTWTSGTVLIINRGSMYVRSSSSNTYSPSTYVNLLNGTQLMGTRGSTTYYVSNSSYRYDQDGSWRYDVLRGYVQNGQPLAKMYAQELRVDGSISAVRELRVVNGSWDNGPYNSTGYWDATNLLEPTYKTQINSNATYPNSDIHFYKVQIRNKTDSSKWDDLCQSGGPGNKAIFMQGYFTPEGRYVKSSQYMGVTCWDGTAAKCMRWGYRPWRSLYNSKFGNIPLEKTWLSCVRAAKADYCGNGESYTDVGKQIDIWDRYGFIKKFGEVDGWIDSSGRALAYSDESAFDENGAGCLVRERLYSYDFSPATCPIVSTYISGGEFCSGNIGSDTWSQCGPKGVVSSPTNVFDRGSISTCDMVATRPPLVYISSYDSGCSTHSPTQTGQALAVDCNCITKTICSMAGKPTGGHDWKLCCGEDSNGHLLAGAWDGQCAQKAIDLLAFPMALTSCSGDLLIKK